MANFVKSSSVNYLPAAGRQIPKITYIAGVVCLLHFTDIALNLGTLRIVQLEQ